MRFAKLWHIMYLSALVYIESCVYVVRQRSTPGISVVAFAAVERQSSSSSSRNLDGQSGNNKQDTDIVLHCIDKSGTMFEASTFGAVWNVERHSSGCAVVAVEAAAAKRDWHVCADLDALLLVRETVRGSTGAQQPRPRLVFGG